LFVNQGERLFDGPGRTYRLAPKIGEQVFDHEEYQHFIFDNEDPTSG
jgi:hypothetical protein